MRNSLARKRNGVLLCIALSMPLIWAVAHRETDAAPLRAAKGVTPPHIPPRQQVLVMGSISGRVTRDGRQPAAGVTVRAVPAALPFIRFSKDNPNTTVTDAGGYYTLLVQPTHLSYYSGPIVPRAKGYLVSVSNGGQPYIEPPPQTVDPNARPSHVATGVDFVLRLGPQVTVRAHDAITHAPVAGIAIRYEAPWPSDGAVGVTGPDGSLRFRVPLTDIRLQADTGRVPTQIAPGYGLFKQITALPGQEVGWEIKTYGTTRDAVYNSDWHGVVLGPDGQPAPGLPVVILRQSYLGGGTTLTTDTQGRFSARLPRLGYGETEETTSPVPVAFARRGDLAAALVVTPDESWDGMTLRLAPGGVVSGTLTDPQGRPAPGVAVGVSGSILGSGWGESPTPDVVTDDRGRFSLDGLPPGDYQVQVHGGGYGTLSIPPPIDRSSVPQPRLSMAAGQHRDLGRVAVPRADRTLAGRVVDTHGVGVPSLYVSVTGKYTHQTAATQDDGTFHAYDLVAEPLTVTAGVSGHAVTTTVTPGPNGAVVRLVAPPDVVATNGRAAPATAPPSALVGPLAVYPAGASAPLDCLALAIRPQDGGKFTAAVLRPNGVEPFGWYTPPVMDSPGDPAPEVWHGTLADLDGMRLSVRHGRGTLADHTGRALWSGVVYDPPDYVVTGDEHPPAANTITVRDGQGKTLWTGAAAPYGGGDVVRDGNIRVIGPAQTVAWERAVGAARVVVQWHGPSLTPSGGLGPEDMTLTLHVVSATATLRSSGGRVLWSGQTPVVMTTPTGLAPPPHPVFVNGQVTRSYLAWSIRTSGLCPPPMLPLLNIQQVPHGASLTFTDAATGRPLSAAPLRYL